MFPSSDAFKNKTLILPAVSFANVGQLASDILISTSLSTSDGESSGHIQSRNILPICGANAYGIGSKLSTPCELFIVPTANVVIMQRRSMCVKGRSGAFAAELVAWFKEQQFKEIIILAGADSGSLRDRAMHEGLQQGLIHFLTTSTVHDKLEYASWQRYTQRERDSNGDVMVSSSSSSSTNYPSNIHFAGISKRLFALCEAQNIPVISLVCFVSEGNNVRDGIRLATSVCEHLPGLIPKGKENKPGRWIIPPSWNCLSQNGPVGPEMFY